MRAAAFTLAGHPAILPLIRGAWDGLVPQCPHLQPAAQVVVEAVVVQAVAIVHHGAQAAAMAAHQRQAAVGQMGTPHVSEVRLGIRWIWSLT
jgi:hypothetical protein